MARSTITEDPVSEQDKFMLRLPKGMRSRIKDAADSSGRSMNAEIVERLGWAYEADSIIDRIRGDLELKSAFLEKLTDSERALRREVKDLSQARAQLLGQAKESELWQKQAHDNLRKLSELERRYDEEKTALIARLGAAEGRAEGFMDVIKLLTDFIAREPGNGPEVMHALAQAISGLSDLDESD